MSRIIPLGIINYMLQSIGLITQNIDWFGDDRYAMPALIAVNIWRGYPFLMISLLAGLQAIPKELYDAAYVDGCNTWRGFWHITIPGLKPVLFSVWTILQRPMTF